MECIQDERLYMLNATDMYTICFNVMQKSPLISKEVDLCIFELVIFQTTGRHPKASCAYILA